MLKRVVLALGLFLAAAPAFGQAVQQAGQVTRNHSVLWNSNGVVQDAGTASDSPLSTLGVDGQFCVMSDRLTAAGRNLLCFQAATSGPAIISLQNYGTATPQALEFILNGVTLTLPSGGGTFLTGIAPYTVGDAVCVSATSGVLQDCGVSVAAGNIGGLPTYSTTGALTSTAAPTNGQIPVGQTGAATVFQTLSGDVSSVSALGAVTLGKVNGVIFNNNYAAHGVLIGENAAAFTSLTTSNIGQCLLSQGSTTDPIWSSCAAGAGSAGGSNTQVQFNNATALGGSANFTWVSPTLTLGVAGSVTGQLGLASSTATGTVILQAPGVSSPYSFNFPISAGTAGLPLLSGGGGTTPNTFGALSVAAGGTGCTTGGGSCIDSISGWSNTGYINRTGSGTYAFSTVIPVSGGGTSLANGTSGGVLAFTSTGTIASSGTLSQYGLVVGGGAGAVPASITNGTAGQLLLAQTSANPSWNTMSGDVSMTSSGVTTVANSAITNAKLANSTAGYSFKGNTASTAGVVTDFTPASLTNKASPAAGDYIVLADNAAGGQLKYATISSIASAGSVASVNGLTGAVNVGPAVNSSGALVSLPVPAPQGRLTLQSGASVQNASVSGSSTIYYDCHHGGQLVPYYSGSVDAVDTISGCEVSLTMQTSGTGVTNNGDVFDVWWVHSGTNRICVATNGSGAGWSGDTTTDTTHTGNTHTSTTIDSISPGGVYKFGWEVGMTITGSGIPSSTTIIAINAAGTSVTLSQATTTSVSGTPLTVSGGTTALRGFSYSQLDTVSHAYITNKNAIANCFNGSSNYGSVAAGQATYLGTLFTTAAGQTTVAFGSAAAGGGPAQILLWNLYNRVALKTSVMDTNTSWSYTCSASCYAENLDNSTGNRVTFVTGVGEDTVYVTHYANELSSADLCNLTVGLSLDQSLTGGASGNYQYVATIISRYNTQGGPYAPTVTVAWPNGINSNPLLGMHYVQAMQKSDGTGCTSTYQAGSSPIEEILTAELNY